LLNRSDTQSPLVAYWGREEQKHYIGGKTDGAIGARIIYLDPHNVGKFYIDASQVPRANHRFSGAKTFIKKVSDKIALAENAE
jgi:hypothetical protein